MAALKQEYIVV